MSEQTKDSVDEVIEVVDEDPLDRPEIEDDPEERRLEAQTDEGAWRGGLAGDERFDLAHWLTLLRADVFGTVQASIVGRLRKRADP